MVFYHLLFLDQVLLMYYMFLLMYLVQFAFYPFWFKNKNVLGFSWNLNTGQSTKLKAEENKLILEGKAKCRHHLFGLHPGAPHYNNNILCIIGIF